MMIPASLPQTFFTVGSRLSLISLSLFVGGIITLGANVAPLLFKTLARPDAGLTMTMIFRRFDAWMTVGLLVLLLGEALKLWSNGLPSEIFGWLRFGVLALFSGLILFSIFILHPQLEAQQALQTAAQSVTSESLPSSTTFHAIHHQSEQFMRFAWMLALTLLIWS
jgi:hypothetical protein